MSHATNWIDRSIDLLRSRSTLFLLVGFALGAVVFSRSSPEERIYLDIENQDNVLIDSVRMEFGFGLHQSNLLTVQLKPGEKRQLVLNHPPGKGFNVEIQYQGGHVQSFCANRDVTSRYQQLRLKR